jgi:hypothetical protein
MPKAGAPLPGSGALPAIRAKRRLRIVTKQVLASWATWLVLGAAAGTGVLLSAGFGASQTDARAPSGLEIEAAVAQAEAVANAARERHTSTE